MSSILTEAFEDLKELDNEINPKNIKLNKNEIDSNTATDDEVEKFERTLHIRANQDLYIADQIINARSEAEALRKFATELSRKGLNGLKDALQTNGKYSKELINDELSNTDKIPDIDRNSGWVTYVEETNTNGKYYVYHTEHKEY